MICRHLQNHSVLMADKLELGEGVTFGSNVFIKVRGSLRIGDYSSIGKNVEIYAEQCEIGNHFFHTEGLKIGGGGSQFFDAILKIGDRCVMHNNYLNLCQPITIGNDVGFSPDCQIVTHGFWKSILDGFPVKYSGVKIEDGVIIGQRSIILMGASIAKDCVIGAQSVVNKPLTVERSVYAGNPARFIRTLPEVTMTKAEELFKELILQYRVFISHYYEAPVVNVEFPYAEINGFRCNVLTGTCEGVESTVSDDFRDYMRRYGIRIYTKRPFGKIVKS
jgi:acetyltransferase-like isoleucine patch superfamily enzyme